MLQDLWGFTNISLNEYIMNIYKHYQYDYILCICKPISECSLATISAGPYLNMMRWKSRSTWCTMEVCVIQTFGSPQAGRTCCCSHNTTSGGSVEWHLTLYSVNIRYRLRPTSVVKLTFHSSQRYCCSNWIICIIKRSYSKYSLVPFSASPYLKAVWLLFNVLIQHKNTNKISMLLHYPFLSPKWLYMYIYYYVYVYFFWRIKYIWTNTVVVGHS